MTIPDPLPFWADKISTAPFGIPIGEELCIGMPIDMHQRWLQDPQVAPTPWGFWHSPFQPVATLGIDHVVPPLRRHANMTLSCSATGPWLFPLEYAYRALHLCAIAGQPRTHGRSEERKGQRCSWCKRVCITCRPDLLVAFAAQAKIELLSLTKLNSRCGWVPLNHKPDGSRSWRATERLRLEVDV